MLKRVRLLSSLILIASMLAAVLASPTPAFADIDLRVTVTDCTTGQPIPGATVTVVTAKGQPSKQTNANGRATFKQIRPGDTTHEVQVTRPGYSPTSKSAYMKAWSDQGLEICLQSGDLQPAETEPPYQGNPLDLGGGICGYVDHDNNVQVIVKFNEPDFRYIFSTDPFVRPGYYVIENPSAAETFVPVNAGKNGLIGISIISWSGYWEVENCYEGKPVEIPPTEPPLIITDTPTPTTTPTPTDTPTPTPTPLPPPAVTQPPVQPAGGRDMRLWLIEKQDLSAELENLSIKTRIFTLPAIKSYDESGARSVIDAYSGQIEQGTIGADDAERFKRMTIQERFLRNMVIEYTETSATVSKNNVDFLKTLFSYNRGLNQIFEQCGNFACQALQQAANKIAWKLVQNLSSQFIKASGVTIGSQETTTTIWKEVIRVVQQMVDGGVGPQDLVKDLGGDYLMTQMMIAPYLFRTQAFIDRGVATVQNPNGAKAYPVTGTSERAELLTKELAQKGKWESELAVSRWKDFNNTAKLADIVIQTADLASLVNPLAAAVRIGGVLEKLYIVNFPLMVINGKSAACIEYLATRGSEIAFNSQQPADDCRYMAGGVLSPESNPKLSLSIVPAPHSALQQTVHRQTQSYQAALEALKPLTKSANQAEIVPALTRLISEQQSLSASLQESQAIIQAHSSQTNNDVLAIAQISTFDLDALVAYLAVAENLTARQNGKTPEVDLSQVIGQTETRLNEVSQAVDRVDLSLPAGKPFLLIRDAAFGPAGGNSLQVKIENLGDSPATNLRIVLTGLSKDQSWPATLPARTAQSFQFDASAAAQPVLTVEVYLGDELVDHVFVAAPRSGSSIAALNPALVAPNSGGGAGIAIILLLVVGSGVGLYVYANQVKRKRSAASLPGTPAPMPVSAPMPVRMPAGARLVFLSGPLRGQTAPLAGDQVTIGRSSGSQVHIPDMAVSRSHALIYLSDGKWRLQDQNSKLGTWVNGRRVTGTALKNGDRIQIGESELRFEIG